MRMSNQKRNAENTRKAQPTKLEVNAFEQHIKTDYQQHSKKHPQFIAVLAGGRVALGHLLALLATGTEQISRLTLPLLALVVNGGVTEFNTPLVTSLLLGIVIAWVVAKLAGFAPKGLAYSKHSYEFLFCNLWATPRSHPQMYAILSEKIAHSVKNVLLAARSVGLFEVGLVGEFLQKALLLRG